MNFELDFELALIEEIFFVQRFFQTGRQNFVMPLE